VTTGLEVKDLTVRFGGLVAVDSVSLAAPMNTITGLIGPNGAGKTTTFNACAGVVRAQRGQIRLGRTDLSPLAPARRAQQGLGRTFQRIELFDSMTVADNVAVGLEATFAGRHPWGQLWCPRGERRDIRARAAEALALCGIDHLGGVASAALSTGHRRLVELARAVASPFTFLLLDEPSSGLDHAETVQFAAILRRVIAERGVGILLVEHDMGLVRDVCEFIYVLDFGQLLYSGPTDDVLSSDVVRAAYLGAAV
jgi:ABC-type branched-subunit amino acid transport system ATPase component